jgi:hypothetical protein
LYAFFFVLLLLLFCGYLVVAFLPELARSGDPAIWYHCRYPNLIRAAPSLRPDMIFGKDRLGNRMIPATGAMSLMKIEF